MQAKETGLGYRIEWKNTLYLVPTPLVKINARNQFHSDHEPSIRWKDGAEIFFLNGVKFEKELWQRVVSREMSFAEILALHDIDQRTQAMRYGNVDAFLKHTKAKQLGETSNKKNTLWRIPKGDIFTTDTYYLVYPCPSTGRIYMSGVPQEIGEKNDPDEAMAWKHHMTKTEYLIMQSLVHES